MKIISLVLSASIALASIAPASADTLLAVFAAPEHRVPVQLVQASCAGAVAQAEAQTGGRAIGAPQLQVQGNQAYCIIVVLVPGSGNNPPQRRTVRVRVQ